MKIGLTVLTKVDDWHLAVEAEELGPLRAGERERLARVVLAVERFDAVPLGTLVVAERSGRGGTQRGPGHVGQDTRRRASATRLTRP